MHLRVSFRSAFRTPQSAFGAAFTRTELLVILGVLSLLALVVLPALANTRPRSARVICANNLRQIGVAFQIWGNDNGDQIPWHVAVPDGGTKLHPLSANAWLHFSWISNELASPRVLFCPSDTGNPAHDFTGSPTGGYLHPNFANRATSYFLNAHPPRIVAGDRNIPVEGNEPCSVVSIVSWVTRHYVSPTFGWTSDLHVAAGNLLMDDGQVEQADNKRFRDAFDYADESGVGPRIHFVLPQ